VLDPGAREALTEQLRPPAGYRLSHAVGTTFTLDMLSALAVPLSFVRGSGEDPGNAVAVLNAIRKVSDRIDVFCQAGLIRTPRQASDLLAVLEPIIHQVLAPRPGALFHPKIWLLEFESENNRAYRFLCSSRNLTPDATWDLLVRLDGRTAEADAGAAPIDSAPLAEFIETLSALATVDLPPTRVERLRVLARRLADVHWELPPDIRTAAFRPLGGGATHTAGSLVTFLRDPDAAVGLNGQSGDQRMFGRDRVVIAPFVDDATVRHLTGSGCRSLDIYGRAEEFDRLDPATLDRPQASFHAIDDIGLSPDTDAMDADVPVRSADPTAGDLRGLHAKAFFTDFDRTTHALIGSANATKAAFGHNIEFAVELTGSKSRIGTEKIKESLSGLPFLEFDGAGGVERTAEQEAEYRLQTALINAAAQSFLLDASRGDREGHYRVDVAHGYAPPSGITARLGLLTLPGRLTAVDPHGDNTRHHHFDGLALEQVTPYVLVELTDTATGMTRTTVAQGALRTDINGRIDHVIASQLDSPERLRQFLLLFLTPEEETPPGAGGPFEGRFGAIGATGSFAGLFEAVAAATTSPDAGRLFRDLKPIMERLYTLSGDNQEIEQVRRLWDAAVAAVEEDS
jgi:hypothetical protein